MDNTIEFISSPGPSIGVELEIQLLDPDTKNLSSMSSKLIDAGKNHNNLLVKPELMDSMIEINTRICHSVGEVRQHLFSQLQALQTLANQHNTQIAMAGTHPFQNWQDCIIFNDPRYHDLLEKFQWLAKRWVTFGMHVHVGIEDGDRAIHIMNSLSQYIPHMIALSASSPFWGGIDTGLESSRLAVLQSFPTGGVPYYFENWKEFSTYFDVMKRSGSIQSLKDIYWDIRPHFDFGTIEIRVFDSMPNLEDTLAAVAFTHCLVLWLDDQIENNKRSKKINMRRYWVAPENKWQAIRYGLMGRITQPETFEQCTIKEDILRLLEELQPVASTLNCTKELNGVHKIVEFGNSARRQKEVFAKTRDFTNVMDSLIQELFIQ